MARAPIVQTLNITTTRTQLSQLVNRVFKRETRVIIEKNGIPVAAIVSAEDAARLQAYESQHREDLEFLSDIQAHFADVPIEEHERQVARAVGEARARLRSRQARSSAAEPA